MEQTPKAEAEQKTGHDAQPSPTLDPKTGDGDHHNRDAPNGDANTGSFVMGSDSQTEQLQAAQRTGSARKSVHWSPELVTESHASSNNSNHDNNNVYLDGSNPYVSSSPAPSSSSSSFSFKGKCLHTLRIYIYTPIDVYFCLFFGAETMGTVKDVLGRWGRKVGEATRKAEDLAGNTWQHCNCLLFSFFFLIIWMRFL